MPQSLLQFIFSKQKIPNLITFSHKKAFQFILVLLFWTFQMWRCYYSRCTQWFVEINIIWIYFLVIPVCLVHNCCILRQYWRLWSSNIYFPVTSNVALKVTGFECLGVKFECRDKWDLVYVLIALLLSKISYWVYGLPIGWYWKTFAF